jgi:glucose-6-phosphate 1-dehydrogenase
VASNELLCDPAASGRPALEPNPLRHGRRMRRVPEPCVIVIFGGSGDLTRRKLAPALFNLSRQRLLPGGFAILGLSRSGMSDDDYRAKFREWVDHSEEAPPPQPETWNPFASRIHYLAADYHQASTYQQLSELLASYDRRHATEGNRLFYLATPPDDYASIVRNLGAAGLARGAPDGSTWTRIIVEKPFGRDLASACALNQEISKVFQENQVYRIDHYLGKETVQNLLVFRFANTIFEPLWNRRYVDNVQITAAENIGIGSRGAYYEQAGAVRDMIQNHVLQLLTLVAMEPPPDFEPNSVRDEKAKVLRSIRPAAPEEVKTVAVRGQYGPGFIAGKQAPGYRQEQAVSPESGVETFAAIKFTVENWRWAGVPFYVRSGKNLAKRVTEIAVIFRPTPHFIFRQDQSARPDSNVLALRIQPDEGITLKFFGKLPGQAVNIRPVNMDFRYGSTFGLHLPSAYERLLLDCMLGDPTLFDRIDSVLASWKLVQPFLDAWGSEGPESLPIYSSGSWGPEQAELLAAKDERRWRLL